jgi:hypothetical protein
VPKSQSTAYRGRKYYTSQSVLVAEDFDLKFTYVLASWEGSAHEASILNDYMNIPDDIQPPEGKFYLRDAGYACRPGIPPFQESPVSSERVLSKEQTTKCGVVVQPWTL